MGWIQQLQQKAVEWTSQQSWETLGTKALYRMARASSTTMATTGALLVSADALKAVSDGCHRLASKLTHPRVQRLQNLTKQAADCTALPSSRIQAWQSPRGHRVPKWVVAQGNSDAHSIAERAHAFKNAALRTYGVSCMLDMLPKTKLTSRLSLAAKVGLWAWTGFRGVKMLSAPTLNAHIERGSEVVALVHAGVKELDLYQKAQQTAANIATTDWSASIPKLYQSRARSILIELLRRLDNLPKNVQYELNLNGQAESVALYKELFNAALTAISHSYKDHAKLTLTEAQIDTHANYIPDTKQTIKASEVARLTRAALANASLTPASTSYNGESLVRLAWHKTRQWIDNAKGGQDLCKRFLTHWQLKARTQKDCSESSYLLASAANRVSQAVKQVGRKRAPAVKRAAVVAAAAQPEKRVTVAE